MSIFIYEEEIVDKLIKTAKTIWITGLSGAGKSTIANELADELIKKDIYVVVLDGDTLRGGLNSDLDYTEKGKAENVRRTAEVAKLLNDSGMNVIVAMISPVAADRDSAKKIIGERQYKEVYLNTPLSICEERDVKGLYKKYRDGKLKKFTGITNIYEIPSQPDLVLDTTVTTVKQCVDIIISKLLNM